MPSLITVGAAAVSVFLLSLALRVIDVGVGYAVWTGIGSVGAVIIGSVLFSEVITPAKVVCLAAIIFGVLGLHLSSRSTATD